MIAFLKKIYKLLLPLLIISLFFYQNKAYSKYIRDTEIENILYTWTKPILGAAGLKKNDLKIHIVADKNINAFVTNGQNMFLNTGLIIKAGSANGLIGVIAHEIGHIKAGHIIKMKQVAARIRNKFLKSVIDCPVAG